jgi:kynureninase
LVNLYDDGVDVLQVGGSEKEVALINTLSVNIHMLLASFYQPKGRKTKVLMEAPAFPSDQYAVETHLKQRGLAPSEHIIEIPTDEQTWLLSNDAICNAIEKHADELALVFFGGVQYISGQVLDMGRITAVAKRCGVVVGWDLAHAVGNVELKLSEWAPDFACWCTYKYLNGGPGSVGGIFVRADHLANPALPRLAGWWGYERSTRFLMQKGFKPEANAYSFAQSNPPILALAPLKASLPMFTLAGLENLRKRSLQLTGHLRQVLLEHKGLEIITPEAEAESGSMLTMRHPRARALFDAMQTAGIVGDWREPGIIRLAPCALYNTIADVEAVGKVL